MRIRQIMSSPVDPIDPKTPVAVAAQKMRDEDVGCLLVGRGDQLFGIVTDRDIVVRAMADGKSAHREPVWSVMTSELVSCFEDQAVEEAARIMAEHGVRRLPVLDRDGRLRGLVSLSDIRGGASRNKPFAVTFYKELPDGRGSLHQVPLSTVYVAGVDCEDEAVAAAGVILQRARGRNRWMALADGYRVDAGP